MDIKERRGESEEDTKKQEVVGTTVSGSDFTKHQYRQTVRHQIRVQTEGETEMKEMQSLTERTRTVVWAADGHPAVDADDGECVHVGHCQEEGGEALDFAADHPPQIALREAGGGGQGVAEDRNADVGDGEVEDEDVVRLDAQLPVAQEHHQRGSVASRCYETCRQQTAPW